MILLFFSYWILLQMPWQAIIPENEEKNLTLVWADEFDYEGLPDPEKWSYDVGDGCPDLCGWGNNELQYYTKERAKNARVADGKLTIELHQEKMGTKDYTSARLVTKGKGHWRYGRFEIKAKLPQGKGVWSAIWMMPVESHYGNWPRSGEIDIMENVGYDPDTVVTATHTLDHHAANPRKASHFLPDADENFHVYTLEWEENEYRVYIDDQHYYTHHDEGKGFVSWPFDQEFYLILNIAYGGNWGGAMGIEPSVLPSQMEVDYVRVYAFE